MRAAVVVAYFAATLLVTYLLWGPWDGMGDAYTGWSVLAPLLLVHVAVGAVLRRWWALLLPVAWAAFSIPADGYDTPVAIGIFFNTPFLWWPALVGGLASGKLLASRRFPAPRSS